MRNNKRLTKLNNKGVSLVTVILIIAFVTILVSVVMMTSLVNHKMKRINAYSKDTFYSAEQVLDEINVGLQRFISDSLSMAYTDIMENYSVYSVEKKRKLLQTSFYENMWSKLEDPTSGHSKYDVNVLYSMLKASTVWQGDLTGPDGYGAIVRAVDEAGNLSTTGTMLTYETGIVLKDLRVYFKDSKGVVSVIQTDIRLTYPDYDFTAGTDLPNLSSYGVIADKGMVVSGSVDLELTGNYYADSFVGDGLAGIQKNITHLGKGDFIIKHDMLLENAAFQNEEQGILWVDGIETNGGDLHLHGTANVADDLNVNGNGSHITMAGIYNGYGNSTTDASKSSSILINGVNSVVDLEDLDSIILAGHAYVGTKSPHSLDELDENDLVFDNERDIFTGESIAVKSDQMMYLVPPECIGVNNATGGSLFKKNPMTDEEYVELQEYLRDYPDRYTEVSLTTPVTKLGGESLARFMQTTAVGGEQVADAERVFVPVNTNGGSLVYYYMKFKNDTLANEYFKTYYNVNKEVYDRYNKRYLDLLTFPNDNSVTTVRTGGYVLEGSSVTDYELVDWDGANVSTRFADNQTLYQERFAALCTCLSEDFTKINDVYTDDLENDIVFDNLIDEEDLKEYIESFGAMSRIDIPGTQGTVVLNYDPGIPVTVGDDDIHLVITTGDVNVTINNFKGTIIADGKVTVSSGINSSIKVDEAVVNSLLRYTNDANEMVANVLRDDKEYIFFLEDLEDDEKLVSTMADLVVYENWKKE